MFRKLSDDYLAEQKKIQTAIPKGEHELEKLKGSVPNVSVFIEKAKQYTEINELTAEILNLFIERVEVGGARRNGLIPPRRKSAFTIGTSGCWTLLRRTRATEQLDRGRIKRQPADSECSLSAGTYRHLHHGLENVPTTPWGRWNYSFSYEQKYS